MLPYFQYSVKKIFDFVKKAFIVIVVYALIIGFFVHFTSDEKKNMTKQTSVSKDREVLYRTFADPKLGKSVSGIVYRSMLCFFTGEVCTDNPTDAEKNFKNSVFGFTANLITLPFANPPASGLYWAYSGLQNAGFVPKSFAAEGVGFASIKPLMNIWETFRNAAYLLIVIVIVSIGFMIMFRMKLNQQTVISIENSLPRLVIALLLITFSFPIAGFLIDLMYFSIILVIYIFSSTGIGDLQLSNLAKMQNEYIGAGFWRIYPQGGNIFNVGNALVNIMPGFLTEFIRYTVGVVATITWIKALTWFFSLFSESISNVGVNIQAGVGGGFNIGGLPKLLSFAIALLSFIFIAPHALSIILSVFFALTLLLLLFRVFFLLLMSYLKVLILVIFSPFILLFESVPGKNSFSFWLKGLIGELIAFPLVVLISLLGYVIVQINTTSSSLSPFPFLTTLDTSSFTALLGMGLVLMTPDLIKMVREGLGLKGLPLAVGPGMFFGGAAMVGGGALGIVGSFGSISMAVPGIKNVITGKLPWLKKYIDPDRPNPPGTQSATGGGAGG